MQDEVKQRKIEHVNTALEQDISVPQRANWCDVRFTHQSLPEVDMASSRRKWGGGGGIRTHGGYSPHTISSRAH